MSAVPTGKESLIARLTSRAAEAKASSGSDAPAPTAAAAAANAYQEKFDKVKQSTSMGVTFVIVSNHTGF